MKNKEYIEYEVLPDGWVFRTPRGSKIHKELEKLTLEEQEKYIENLMKSEEKSK